MKVAFASKVGRALMGEVIEDNENVYIVKVTAYESKKDKNLVGVKMLVNKSNARQVK